MAGGWWVDFENALAIKEWAQRFDLSLAQAAQALLVIPPEWHDCGYVGRGRLKTAMKAWVGHGKPATGTLSPDNAARRTTGAHLHAAPAAQSLKQYLHALADELSETATTDEALYHLVFRREIEAGLVDSEAGCTVPMDEVMRHYGLHE